MTKHRFLSLAVIAPLALCAQPRLDGPPSIEPVVVFGYKKPLVQTEYCGQKPAAAQLISNHSAPPKERLVTSNALELPLSWHDGLENWAGRQQSQQRRPPENRTVAAAANLFAPTLPLRCYPNPAAAELWIDLPAPARLLSAYNEAGQLVFQQSNLDDGAFRLNVSAWPAGVYWLEWQGEAERRSAKTVVAR